MMCRTGRRFEPFLREDLIGQLWDKLAHRERCVRTSCEISDIEQDEKGVVVHLKDGSKEVGDIVIGADGVHSQVRDIMWKQANNAVPGIISQEDKSRTFLS
jgi:2-polyprenyl-6-methoxyphenol hydroxylase-like FAD-dependent oxidoreductase